MLRSVELVREKKEFSINYRNNTWFLFGIVCAVSTLLTILSQYLLISDELYFNSFVDQLSYEQIEVLIDNNRKWAWTPYPILILFSLIKFTVLASCLGLGYYFSENRFLFRLFFIVSMKSELILYLPALVKLIWFLFIQTDYHLHDLQYFYPLSLLNLFDPATLEPWLTYPLQLLNVFELLYWFALAYGIAQTLEMPMEKAFGLVASSYGLGLLLWVVFVMFLTISFT
ncbi:hypothetical protein [Larkinella sp.]|uniref:hypothetical protein n=1 Tax=Larkinella sp. TaxID=2034517 RepID=UPI003BAD09F1